MPMLSKPLQRSAPIRKEISQIESVMIEKEVEDVLTKGVITSVNQEEDQFLRTFLVPKKDGYQRPLINLKHLNQFIPYQHSKMEDLLRFKKVLLKGNYMHKLDLQDAYFLVPLNKKSRKYVRFLWSNNLYEFMCLCFGLGSAPRVFTDLLKIPIALLPRLNIRLFI